MWLLLKLLGEKEIERKREKEKWQNKKKGRNKLDHHA